MNEARGVLPMMAAGSARSSSRGHGATARCPREGLLEGKKPDWAAGARLRLKLLLGQE